MLNADVRLGRLRAGLAALELAAERRRQDEHQAALAAAYEQERALIADVDGMTVEEGVRRIWAIWRPCSLPSSAGNFLAPSSPEVRASFIHGSGRCNPGCEEGRDCRPADHPSPARGSRPAQSVEGR